MARKRIYKNPARVHILTETATAVFSRDYSEQQGFSSHNEYLNRLMVADTRRKISLAHRAGLIAKKKAKPAARPAQKSAIFLPTPIRVSAKPASGKA